MQMTALPDKPQHAPSAPISRGGLWGGIDALDKGIIRWLNKVPLPSWLALPLILLVRIGDGWIWGMLAVYLWFALPPERFKVVVLHCCVAIAISLLLYWPIKLLVRRARPHNADLGVTAKVPPLDKFSFPSGHTMNNLAVSLTLALYLPRLFAPALAIPLLLGALRVVFGVHFLSDIVGGAFLGTLGFFLAKVAFGHFPIWP